MKKMSIGTVILAALLIIGCNKGFYTSSGGLRPKKNKFLLSKEQLPGVANDKIDTNFLYLNVYRNMYLGPGKRGDTYQFYRFYKNGRFQMSTSYFNYDDYPEFQNINAGKAGYYKLKNDSLLFEFFAPTNGGEYIYIDGIIKNGLIILKKIYPRNNAYSNKKNDTLVKTAIRGIPLQPDW